MRSPASSGSSRRTTPASSTGRSCWRTEAGQPPSGDDPCGRRSARPASVAPSLVLCGRVLAAATFDELLDHLLAERRQVVGLAAGHQSVVDVHLLVDPCAAGV